MSRQGEPQQSPGGKTGFSNPLLRLRAPRVDGPSYQELRPGHSLYQLAAWVYHHSDDLPERVRRGLFISLEEAWPQTQGDYKEKEHRALAAWKAHQEGASIEEIGGAFAVTPDTARRWVQQGDRDLGTHGTSDFAVDVVWSEYGAIPDDPAAGLAYAKYLVRDSDQLARQLEDQERATVAMRAARSNSTRRS